jgi:glycosyltransferase involved in cell wall biosynthesis
MRILMITDFYHPFLGGVEQHVRTLSHTLVARGHHVAVATLQQGTLPAKEMDHGVTIYRVTATASRATVLFQTPERPWAAPFPDPEVVLGVQRVIATEQPDIVHGHDWLARSYLPLKPLYKAKFVVSYHYYTRSCAKKNLMEKGNPCTGPAWRKCLSCAADHYGRAKGMVVVGGNWVGSATEQKMADAMISVSRATAQGNRMTPAPNHYIIPNFVTEPPPTPSADLASSLDQLPKEPFILFVGDVRRDKGIDVLLEAYTALKNAPPLVLIGKRWGESPTTLPPNVFFFEKWNNHAVRVAWQRALFGVVPSRWAEPFGIVVIEAMMAGKPVIGTEVGGIPEIITDGVSGVLVPPDDVSSLQAAMHRLIADPALRLRLGEQAWIEAQRYHVERVVPEIEAVYERIRGKG